MTERTDVFRGEEGLLLMDVMGVFEVVADRIVAWRDYFDLGQWQRQQS